MQPLVVEMFIVIADTEVLGCSAMGAPVNGIKFVNQNQQQKLIYNDRYLGAPKGFNNPVHVAKLKASSGVCTVRKNF